MTPNDLASLNDVYSLLKSPEANKQTSYILQFIWRDLTSEFDIVGPYFTSPSTVDCQLVVACVFETIELFELHGLKTSVLVCDGGSANVAAIKASHDCHGAYSISEDQEDKYKVTPWMINPYRPTQKIFWLICPSHHLKKMINALFLSKLNGTKQFRRGDKCTFGWQTIMDLYKRELARVSQNCIRMVPHLKEANCLRDAWTKLNVHPAKIMQQEQVLGELYWYTQQDPLPEDPNFPHTSATQKSFLSWQTWDLLWIDVYSFKALCQWFREMYPTYFISPLRLSRSAVESLFSQYKHNAGGKLDSSSFPTARATHLVKQCVSGHHSGKGYRDDKLRKHNRNTPNKEKVQ
ncbi:uncharacterized protein [Dysidea avara]|uniref:uncharacterized protein isoform X3 n=1 Tax=Dysidea avara TaxID=196820 RepID=UPI003330A3C2